MWTLYAMKEFYHNKREIPRERGCRVQVTCGEQGAYCADTRTECVCALTEQRGLGVPTVTSAATGFLGRQHAEPPPLASESEPGPSPSPHASYSGGISGEKFNQKI
jgi:hypothetical protein